MIPQADFDEIMAEIMSGRVDEHRVTGAGTMAFIATRLDNTQANAFAEALARKAAAEPDSEARRKLLSGVSDLIEVHDIDPATLQPVFDIPRDQLTEENAGYVDDFLEYRGFFT